MHAGIALASGVVMVLGFLLFAAAYAGMVAWLMAMAGELQ
jgi:hypothetical protein